LRNFTDEENKKEEEWLDAIFDSGKDEDKNLCDNSVKNN
jgi:hypothetical protein